MMLLALLACGPPPEPALWVTAGCDWVQGRCGLAEDAPLVVWLGGRGEHRVSLDGAAMPAEATPIEGGVRLTVAAPVALGDWTFELDGAAASVHVERTTEPGPLDCPSVETELATTGTLPTGDAWARAARCGWDDPPVAIERLERAVAQHRRDGQDSRAARRTAALAHRLMDARDLEPIQGLLEQLPGIEADHRWVKHYYGARVLSLQGRSRDAEPLDAEAQRWAHRGGLDLQAARSTNVRALVAYESGDTERAIELASTLDDRGCLPQSRYWAHNLRWFRMRAAVDTGDTRAIRAAAADIEALLQIECGDAPTFTTEVYADLAVALLFAGEPDAAVAYADAAVALSTPRPYTAAWLAWVHASAEPSPERAIERFAEAAQLARTAHNPEVEMRALTGRAQRLADVGDAGPAFDLAMDTVQDVAVGLPWEGGRGAWIDSMAGLVGARVAWDLGQGHPEDALTAVRQARSLLLRSLQRTEVLDQLDTGLQASQVYWSLRAEQDAVMDTLAFAPEDQLPAIEARLQGLERQLAASLEEHLQGVEPARLPALELGPDDWAVASWPYDDRRFVFLAGPDGLQVETLPRQPTLLQWRELLATLPSAASVRVLGLGPDETEVLADFDAALGDRPVAWSLDVEAIDRPAGTGRLVVADPLGDLPQAREEAQRIQRDGDTVLLGPGASVERVLDALAEVSSAHFAVHGLHIPGTPAASHLVLADGVLRASDVLALERVPAQVFLSGCETGKRRHALGLAQSFVAAGASQVVASDRLVSDADTRTLVDAWSRAVGSPAERLSLAKRQLLIQNPQADSTAWRLWTP